MLSWNRTSQCGAKTTTPDQAQRDALVRLENPTVLKECVTAADAALVHHPFASDD
jgi:hypothetical protein